ncbi:AraC family transcriptional regulator [Thalassotalea mangrovi]|uniref:Helix-turn-helix transcriptional regulator n=1 Tax=Thalassotalea mangrovi TaxID=2572245 RepID=A0A4U1B538_9GAMM|nr:helix-turn-helix domain-containing protein [Thalassotalea mangrovi]TKB45118.1 helix-turn-helix transcriptional regulator [Thalassotalea mangrovi]
MSSLNLFLSHFAFAQFTLALLVLFPRAGQSLQIRLYCVLMLTTMFYLLPQVIGPLTLYSPLWLLVFLASNILPGVFFLVGLSVFSDHIEIRLWQYLLAVTPLTIACIAQIMLAYANPASALVESLALTAKVSVMLIELGLILYTLFIALKFWRNDLVAERRFIRGAVISFCAAYIFLVIFVEQLLGVRGDWLLTGKLSLLAILATGLNMMLMQVKANSMFEPPQQIPEKTDANEPLLQQLNKAMLNDKLYQQEGITIARLAKHLGYGEQKLRALINGVLGYRNFNDYLNFFRIEEVSKQLLLPENTSTPILTLAMNSGFRSLSSFNKAFKDTHGVTPSQYRKNHGITYK